MILYKVNSRRDAVVDIDPGWRKDALPAFQCTVCRMLLPQFMGKDPLLKIMPPSARNLSKWAMMVATRIPWQFIRGDLAIALGLRDNGFVLFPVHGNAGVIENVFAYSAPYDKRLLNMPCKISSVSFCRVCGRLFMSGHPDYEDVVFGPSLFVSPFMPGQKQYRNGSVFASFTGSSIFIDEQTASAIPQKLLSLIRLKVVKMVEPPLEWWEGVMPLSRIEA